MQKLKSRIPSLVAMRTAPLGVILAVLIASDGIAAPGRSVWDGIYTAAQADRGAKVLAEQCVLCHGEAMRGGGGVPSAVGPEFMVNWQRKTVGELFTYLKTTMPPTAPGALPDQKYADAVAALLMRNGFPAGDSAELSSDPQALQDVFIDEKGK